MNAQPSHTMFYIVQKHVPNTSCAQDEARIITAINDQAADAQVYALQDAADRDCPDGFDPVEWIRHSIGITTREEAEHDMREAFVTAQ